MRERGSPTSSSRIYSATICRAWLIGYRRSIPIRSLLTTLASSARLPVNCVAEPVTQVSKCRAAVRLLAVSKRDGQGSPTPSDQAYRKLSTVDRHNSGSRPMQRATTVGDHSWDRPELGLGSQWRTRGATICLALMTEWLPLHSPLAVDTPHWNRTARHGVEFDRGPPGGPSAVECERGRPRSVHLIRHD